MKRQLLITITGALAAIILPACVDRSAMNVSAEKGNEPNIIITQPAATDAIAPVVETLRHSFTRTAEATSGAQVPNPQISILLPDGKAVIVQAPNVDGGLFGSASPKARQSRIEGQLKSLEAKLIAGCGGKSISARVVQENHGSGFKPGTFTVWAAAGGENPWTADETKPLAFLEDAVAFADLLGGAQGKGGNFVILSEPLDVADGEKTLEGISSSEVDPGGSGKAKAERTAGVVPHNGDTFIVDVKNYPSSNRDEPTGVLAKDQQRLTAISLPPGVVPVGNAIKFAQGSAKLTETGLAALKEAANLLRQRDDATRLRLFLVAKADYRDTEERNERLSQKRAAAVQAALLVEGISIEKTIAVGESLSPDDATKTELAEQRSVQLWALPERVAGLTVPGSPLARQVP